MLDRTEIKTAAGTRLFTRRAFLNFRVRYLQSEDSRIVARRRIRCLPVSGFMVTRSIEFANLLIRSVRLGMLKQVVLNVTRVQVKYCS